MGYRIGIDVGERSVGFAAVDYDDDGWPIELLATVSHIHDGGMDPDTARSPQSRLATAGVARRTRRLVRNRRRRLADLDAVLRKHGYPVPADEVPQTHDAWHARARLADEFVASEAERAELLSLAVRHLARHRGWRNPWWSYSRLTEAPSPSEHLSRTLAAAADRFGDVVSGCVSVGQLVSRIAASGAPIRPTKKAQENPLGQVLADQVRQEDGLAELRMILEAQRVPATAADDICQAVFWQNPPRIPKDRVGRCIHQPDQLRATVATLEFQEFRIRAAVGNLRVGRAAKDRLTAADAHAAVQFLLEWREDAKPRWRDLAEHLGIPTRELIDVSLDGSGGSVAPHDRTSSYVEAKYRKSSAIGSWWLTATPADRAEFIDLVTDRSGESEPTSESLALLLSNEDILAELDKLSTGLESGRAAYSRDTLERLNTVMRERRCDLHDARKAAFDIGDDWTPPRPTFDGLIEHPTVARVNTLVRRFLTTAVQRWGVPEAVVVEHVRDAFMGPAAVAELKHEIAVNTRRRETTAQQLVSQGIPSPRGNDIRRNECVQRQNSVCVYCGTAIGLTDCELDHIVARARGGSSRRDNLVAVCRSCNAAKEKQPFAVFAARSKNPAITVEQAQQRVRNWQRGQMTIKTFRRFQSDVQKRLALTADDELDERSMESTAYAAREMRARIESFLDAHAGSAQLPRGRVVVLSGIATSEARKAGHVDDRLRLRGATEKSRFDRRHHAIDAAVLTTLDVTVARTLRDRANMRRDTFFAKTYPNWKDYDGSSDAERGRFASWRERIAALAGLLEEAIRADRVPVVRQLRLTPRVGAVHADTIVPMVRKTISDAFTVDEVQRVVDRGLFGKLTNLAKGVDLGADPQRAAAIRWPQDRPVELYPSTAAFLPVRGGAAAIGGTIRYARVFAWPKNDGYDYGMIRLYVGEFAKIGFTDPGVDIFTAPLPAHSMAIRTANPALLKRIASGAARQIGWITVDDELEIDPTAFMGDDSEIRRFLDHCPERSWTVTGIYNATTLSLAPGLLALEGASPATPAPVVQVLKANRVRISLNQVFRSPGCTVVRRTVTGAPRWQSSGLPTSWRTREAADDAFSR